MLCLTRRTSTARRAGRASSALSQLCPSDFCRWRDAWVLSGLRRMSRYPRVAAGVQGDSGAWGGLVGYPRGRGGHYSRLQVTVRVLAVSLKRPIAVVGRFAWHQDRSGHRFAFSALVRTCERVRIGRER